MPIGLIVTQLVPFLWLQVMVPERLHIPLRTCSKEAHIPLPHSHRSMRRFIHEKVITTFGSYQRLKSGSPRLQTMLTAMPKSSCFTGSGPTRGSDANECGTQILHFTIHSYCYSSYERIPSTSQQFKVAEGYLGTGVTI